MRAVMLDVPEELLEERRRLGIDRFDEVWDGVLHMVPPPSSRHQRLAHELGAALLAVARGRGLVAVHEVGLYRPGVERTDYRVPDLVYARPEHVSHRGVEGRAELVIEVLSPGDETYEKMPFYAEMGVRELLVVDQSTARGRALRTRRRGAAPAADRGQRPRDGRHPRGHLHHRCGRTAAARADGRDGGGAELTRPGTVAPPGRRPPGCSCAAAHPRPPRPGVVEGTPERVAKTPESHTGRFLAPLLGV